MAFLLDNYYALLPSKNGEKFIAENFKEQHIVYYGEFVSFDEEKDFDPEYGPILNTDMIPILVVLTLNENKYTLHLHYGEDQFFGNFCKTILEAKRFTPTYEKPSSKKYSFSLEKSLPNYHIGVFLLMQKINEPALSKRINNRINRVSKKENFFLII